MPKKQDETYTDYKRRMIDPKSASFCAAKWYNATIWLGSGTTASCHHPPAHNIDAKEVLSNPAALHNTRHKKLMRKLMLKGERPSECDYCWRIEDIKRDNVSDRILKTVIYKDQDVESINSWKEDTLPKTLEIAFDANCNFACSYCNASFSSTWQKDIKQSGPYQNLVSDGAAAFQQDGSWAQKYKKNEENPYIKAFWNWWPQLSESLTELRITGGEPLMSPDVWKLFDFFRDNPSDIRLAINSNLGAKPDLIEKFVEKSHHVEHLALYTSCEATGLQAEYIRDGLNYDVWKQNVVNILENAKLNSGLHIMMTINSLCLFSITDLFDQILQWKEKYGSKKIIWSINLLRFPSFMSPLALPDHIKDSCRKDILSWQKQNEKNPLVHEIEQTGVQRLVDYLETVDNPHSFVSGIESRHRDFRSFYSQYDQRRAKNFHKTFPQIIVDWYDQIEDTKLLFKQKLVDGDATKWAGSSDIKKVAKKEGWCLDPQDVNPGSTDFKGS